MIAEKKIKFTNPNFTSAAGQGRGYFFNFFPETLKLTNISSCRESFRNGWSGQTSFVGFISNDPKLAARVSDFFERVETMLKVKGRSVVHTIEGVSNVVVVEMVPFWIETSMRREVFTLFYRYAALHHQKTDKEFSWSRYELARMTNSALNYFLSGFTGCSSGFAASGWVNATNGASESLLKTHMLKPTDKENFEKMEEPKPEPAKVVKSPIRMAKITLSTSRNRGESFEIVKESVNYVHLKVGEKTLVYLKTSVQIQ